MKKLTMVLFNALVCTQLFMGCNSNPTLPLYNDSANTSIAMDEILPINESSALIAKVIDENTGEVVGEIFSKIPSATGDDVDQIFLAMTTYPKQGVRHFAIADPNNTDEKLAYVTIKESADSQGIIDILKETEKLIHENGKLLISD